MLVVRGAGLERDRALPHRGDEGRVPPLDFFGVAGVLLHEAPGAEPADRGPEDEVRDEAGGDETVGVHVFGNHGTNALVVRWYRR